MQNLPVLALLLFTFASGFNSNTPLIQPFSGKTFPAVRSKITQPFFALNRKFPLRTSSKLYQTPSLPSWDELSQQKSEALRSISEYHDGTWVCENGAISCDVSGGSIMRSSPFQTSVSTRLGLAADYGEALKLVETISWKQKDDLGLTNDASDDGGNTFFGRSCTLGALADVDAVDGSYSLHSSVKEIDSDQSSASSCAVPQSISGMDSNKITSVIENCLVATETERVRCFMIYGKSGSIGSDTEGDSNSLDEQRLQRIVVSHETKLQKENDLGDIIQDAVGGGADNRLGQLASSMSGAEDLGQNVKYPINMMSLSVGPWLGDAIIRDKSFNSLLPSKKGKGSPSKGFGAPRKETPPKKMNHESGFGEWVLGVQKVAMTFKYDFDCNVRQTFDYGKSMGVYVEGWPRQSAGIIYDDRMSRRIKPEDRSMYIDYDNGAYCGFIFGSVYLKAPRFLTSQRQGSALPMLTEFALFQRPEDEKDVIEDVDGFDDICCSRITRLYNDDGTLKQGCTSFFVIKPMVEANQVEP